jgi:sortase A
MGGTAGLLVDLSSGAGPIRADHHWRDGRPNLLWVIRGAANIAGRVVLALGVLVLLFVAFQLWGTGLLEAHDQSALRGELIKTLPHGATDRAARIAAHPPKAKATSGPPAVAQAAAAPAVGQPIGTIQIPNIGLDQVVVEGVGTAQLEMGPGHYPGTPLPGEQGNVAIAGHRTTYAHPFYDLNEVTPGDTIVLTTAQGVFIYTADGQQVVQPTDVAVVGPSASAELTLTTCNPRYSAATRLVVTATLTSSLLFSATSTPVDTGHSGNRRSASRTTGRGSATLPGTGLAGAGGGSSGRWAAAVGLGIATVAVAVAVWLVARRARRRWTVYLPGAAAVLVVLFFFFAVVSPLLPASL